MSKKWRPTKSLSQNLLRRPELAQTLVELSELQPGNHVFEIGTGFGALTIPIYERVKQFGSLTSVEIDPYLFQQTKQTFPNKANLQILNQDVADFDWSLLPLDYVLVANLPFHLTSNILSRSFDLEHNSCSAAHVVVQREAAMMFGGNRLGGIESFKSLLNAPYYDTEIRYQFRPNDFYPRPKVDTVFVSFTKKSELLVSQREYSIWKEFVSIIVSDRVGEGVWRRIFSREQLGAIKKNCGLNWRKGLQHQTFEGYLQVFNDFALPSPAVVSKVNKLYQKSNKA